MDTEKKAISETVSENKKKRGRPEHFSAAYLQKAANDLAPNVKSRRGRQNLLYRQFAINMLIDDPRFEWLCNKEKMWGGDR